MTVSHRAVKNFSGSTPAQVADDLSSFLENPNRGGFADAPRQSWAVLEDSLKFHPKTPKTYRWTQTAVRLQ
jgi:hypothetical protein